MKFKDYDTKLERVLAEHAKWLNPDEVGGKRINPDIMEPFLAYHDNYFKNNGEEQRQLNLSGQNLAKADFHDCILQDAIFKDSNLQGANFENANLNVAKLERADLTGANLQNANCYYTYMHGCILSANLYTNIIIEAAYLDDEELLMFAGLDFKINARQQQQLKTYQQEKYFNEGIAAIRNLNSETNGAIINNKTNRKWFTTAAIACFGLAIVGAIAIFCREDTKRLYDITHLLPFTFPVIMLLFLGTGVLRHISKLNDQYVELTRLKYQEEKATGLLNAAQYFTLYNQPTKDGDRDYVTTTFEDVRRAMLFEQPQQPPASSVKEEDLINKLLEQMKKSVTPSEAGDSKEEK